MAQLNKIPAKSNTLTNTAKGKPLTPKQALFVQEYLVDLNAVQAALRAGYSKATAKRASALLKQPLINEAVDKALAKRSKRVEVTQDRIIKELAGMAFSDLRDVAAWTGDSLTLKSSDQLTHGQAVSIKEIATTTTNKTKVTLHNKIKALELLMRHMGMLNDKLSVTGGVDISLLEQARERAKNKEQL